MSNAMERRVARAAERILLEEAARGRGGTALRKAPTVRPTVQAAPTDQAFEQLHPRAGGGKFGAKAKAAKPASRPKKKHDPPVGSPDWVIAQSAPKHPSPPSFGGGGGGSGAWGETKPATLAAKSPSAKAKRKGSVKADVPADEPYHHAGDGEQVFRDDAVLDQSEVVDNRQADWDRMNLTHVFVPNGQPGGKGQWVEKGHLTDKQQRAVQRAEEKVRAETETRVNKTGTPSYSELARKRAGGGSGGGSGGSANLKTASLAATTAHPPPYAGGPYKYDGDGNTLAQGGEAPFIYNDQDEGPDGQAAGNYTKAGFDSEGLDENGFYADGYDDLPPAGQDADGFDRNGWNDNGERADGTSGYDADGNWIGPPGQDPNDQPDDSGPVDEDGNPIEPDDPAGDAADEAANKKADADQAKKDAAADKASGLPPGTTAGNRKAGKKPKKPKARGGHAKTVKPGAAMRAQHPRKPATRHHKAAEATSKADHPAPRGGKALTKAEFWRAQWRDEGAVFPGDKKKKRKRTAREAALEESLHGRFEAMLHPRGRGGQWRETFTAPPAHKRLTDKERSHLESKYGMAAARVKAAGPSRHPRLQFTDDPGQPGADHREKVEAYLRNLHSTKHAASPPAGPALAQVMAKRERAGAELHIHRSTGEIEKRPAHDLEAAKAEGLKVKASDPTVHRVALHDTMRDSEVWSSDDAWHTPADRMTHAETQARAVASERAAAERATRMDQRAAADDALDRRKAQRGPERPWMARERRATPLPPAVPDRSQSMHDAPNGTFGNSAPSPYDQRATHEVKMPPSGPGGGSGSTHAPAGWKEKHGNHHLRLEGGEYVGMVMPARNGPGFDAIHARHGKVGSADSVDTAKAILERRHKGELFPLASHDVPQPIPPHVNRIPEKKLPSLGSSELNRRRTRGAQDRANLARIARQPRHTVLAGEHRPDLAGEPGRTRGGKLVDFHVVNGQQLRQIIRDLTDSARDEEALRAARAEQGRRRTAA